MTIQSRGPASEIRLQCCGGNPVPQVVAEGWKTFANLPPAARDSIWDLFRQTLLAPDNSENESRIEEFCSTHEADPAKVVEAIRSCDYLIRSASALNLSREVFGQDLAALSADDPSGAKVILSQFEAVKLELRKAIVEESLADHGKVLVGLDWRVDNVAASDRGVQIDSSVVFLTLRYREFDALERLTLQLTPDAVQYLKSFVERFGN